MDNHDQSNEDLDQPILKNEKTKQNIEKLKKYSKENTQARSNLENKYSNELQQAQKSDQTKREQDKASKQNAAKDKQQKNAAAADDKARANRALAQSKKNLKKSNQKAAAEEAAEIRKSIQENERIQKEQANAENKRASKSFGDANSPKQRSFATVGYKAKVRSNKTRKNKNIMNKFVPKKVQKLNDQYANNERALTSFIANEVFYAIGSDVHAYKESKNNAPRAQNLEQAIQDLANKKGISPEEALEIIKNKGSSNSKKGKNDVSNRGSKDLENVYKHNLRMQEQMAMLIKHGIIQEEDMNLYALYQTPTPYPIYETFKDKDGKKVGRIIVGFAENKDQILLPNQDIQEFFEFTYAEVDPITGNFIGDPLRLNYNDITDEMRVNVKKGTHTLYQNCVVVMQKYLPIEDRKTVLDNNLKLSKQLLEEFKTEENADKFEEVSQLKETRRSLINLCYKGVKALSDKDEVKKDNSKKDIYNIIDGYFENGKNLEAYNRAKKEVADKRSLIEKIEIFLNKKGIDVNTYDAYYAERSFRSISLLEESIKNGVEKDKLSLFKNNKNEDDKATTKTNKVLSSTNKDMMKELEVYISTYLNLQIRAKNNLIDQADFVNYKVALENDIKNFIKQKCNLTSLSKDVDGKNNFDFDNFDTSIKSVLKELYNINYPNENAKERFTQIKTYLNLIYSNDLPCDKKDFSRYLYAKGGLEKNIETIVKFETSKENSTILKNVFKDLEEMIKNDRFIDIQDKQKLFNSEFFKKHFNDISYEDIITYMDSDAFKSKVKKVYDNHISAFNKEGNENEYLLKTINSFEFAAFSLLFDKNPALPNLANMTDYTARIAKLLHVQFDLAKYNKHILSDYNKSSDSLEKTQTNITTVLSFPNGAASIFNEVDGLTILELSAYRHRQMYPNTLLLNTALHTAEMKDHAHCQATTYDYIDKSFNQKQTKINMVNDFNFRKYIHRLEHKFEFEKAIDRAIENFITNAVDIFNNDKHLLLEKDDDGNLLYDFSLNSFLPSLQEELNDFVEQTKIYEASFGNLSVPVNIYIDQIYNMVDKGVIPNFMDTNTLKEDVLRSKMNIIRDCLLEEYNEEPRLYNYQTLTDSANRMFGSDFELMNFSIVKDFFEQEHIKAKYPQIDILYTDLGEQKRYLNKMNYKTNVESILKAIAKNQHLDLKQENNFQKILLETNLVNQTKNTISMSQEIVRDIISNQATLKDQEDKIVEAAQKIEQNEVLMKELNKQIEVLQSEYSTDVENKDKINKLINSLKDKTDKLKKEKEKLEADKTALDNEKKVLDDEKNNLQTKNEELKQQIDIKIKTLDSIEQRNQEKEVNKILLQKLKVADVNTQKLLDFDISMFVEDFLIENDYTSANKNLKKIILNMKAKIEHTLEATKEHYANNKNEQEKQTNNIEKKLSKEVDILVLEVERMAIEENEKIMRKGGTDENTRRRNLSFLYESIKDLRAMRPIPIDTSSGDIKNDKKKSIENLLFTIRNTANATWTDLTNNMHIKDVLNEKDLKVLHDFAIFLSNKMEISGYPAISIEKYLNNSKPSDFVLSLALFEQLSKGTYTQQYVAETLHKDIKEKHNSYARKKDINTQRYSLSPD